MSHNQVVAHIAGPSGVGKSELARRLQSEMPEWIFLDLDDIDDQAIETARLPFNKDDYTDAMLDRLHDTKQTLLNQRIRRERKPLVLVGHHIESGHILAIPAVYKILMTGSPTRGVVRRYVQGKYSAKDVLNLVAQGRDDITVLSGLGYRKMSPQQIYSMLRSLYAKGHPQCLSRLKIS